MWTKSCNEGRRNSRFIWDGFWGFVERVWACHFIDRGRKGGTELKVKHLESWNGLESKTILLNWVCCRVLEKCELLFKISKGWQKWNRLKMEQLEDLRLLKGSETVWTALILHRANWEQWNESETEKHGKPSLRLLRVNSKVPKHIVWQPVQSYNQLFIEYLSFSNFH